jgi:hypothetical protein
MEPISIGSSTHTRVDSAAKHIRQCKIHERLMMFWFGQQQGQEAMHRQKNKFATMKDDLVLNVNESLTPGFAPTDAYPSVLSNFTSLGPHAHEVLKTWYSQNSPEAFFQYQKRIKKKDLGNLSSDSHVNSLPFFRAQGYALGRAEATMRSGDTVFSVLIGGQMTVQNGHFPMRPGQMVQWYFEFEEPCFEDDGRRSDKIRVKRDESELGKRAHAETNAESTCYARPKPYVLGTDGSEHYGDKIRIFAKCIAGGGPHHKVDIMLMTQSL